MLIQRFEAVVASEDGFLGRGRVGTHNRTGYEGWSLAYAENHHQWVTLSLDPSFRQQPPA